MLGRTLVPLLSTVALLASFVACVSDDGGALPTKDSGTGADVISPLPDAGTQPDVEVPCPENLGECDGKPATRCETDLRVSSEHCGACGRSCDGVSCKNGECENEKLVDGRSQPVSFLAVGGRIVWLEALTLHGCLYSNCASGSQILADVNGNPGGVGMPLGTLNPHLLLTDGKNFFFSQCAPNSNFDCSLVSCELGGCKGSGPTYLTTVRQGHRALIVVNGGTKPGEGGLLDYHPLDGFHRYAPPLSMNATAVSLFSGPDTESVQSVIMGATNFVWVDGNTSQANPDGGLYACPNAGCGANRVKLLPPPVKHLAIAKAAAFVAYGNAGASSIVSCDLVAGCNQTGTVLAKDQAYVSDIVADENAIYWATTGTATPTTNNVAGGQIMMCPLPTCAGGPKRIADTQVNPMALALDGNFVYWMNRGAPATNTGSIWRRRR